MSSTTYSGQLSGTSNRETSEFDWGIGYSYPNKSKQDKDVVQWIEHDFPYDKHFV